ncbi:MAG TPA: hypothetical protein VFH73_17920 [Polyangia bacterium]|jgi:hypothetical protein|nr:hypothetical protein [Polyangia bacterium]
MSNRNSIFGAAARTTRLVSAVMIVLGLGCSKAGDADKASGIPPQATAPSPSAVAAAPPPPGPPPAVPEPVPTPAAAAAPEAKPDPQASITGEIVVAPAVKASVKKEDVIYLVARRISDNPTARGSLVAVKKFSAASFPIPFSLGAADMMFQNGAFEGDLALSVRVDKDGDPMTRRKGDVFGGLPKVRVGAKSVKLSLNQIQKEDESLASPGGPDPHAPSPVGPLPKGHP